MITPTLAARVRPVHVTVTLPALSVAVASTVIVIVLVVYADVLLVCGEEMVHLFSAFAVT